MLLTLAEAGIAPLDQDDRLWSKSTPWNHKSRTHGSHLSKAVTQERGDIELALGLSSASGFLEASYTTVAHPSDTSVFLLGSVAVGASLHTTLHSPVAECVPLRRWVTVHCAAGEPIVDRKLPPWILRRSL